MIYPVHFQSPLGVATCDTCHGEWPCHLLAWGDQRRKSNCLRCGEGVVSFRLPDVVVSCDD